MPTVDSSRCQREVSRSREVDSGSGFSGHIDFLPAKGTDSYDIYEPILFVEKMIIDAEPASDSPAPLRISVENVRGALEIG